MHVSHNYIDFMLFTYHTREKPAYLHHQILLMYYESCEIFFPDTRQIFRVKDVRLLSALEKLQFLQL